MGRELALEYVSSLIKVVAGLKELRAAPGDMGVLKSIQIGTERSYLTSDWAELTFDPTTWKLHFDGFGSGVYRGVASEAVAGRNLNLVAQTLKKEFTDGQVPNGTTDAPKDAPKDAPNGTPKGKA